MAKRTNQVETNEVETNEVEPTGRRQWANELLRAHSGSGTAAKRFTKLADYLCNEVAQPGKTVTVSFAKANAGAGLQRGATGDAGNSWRLALQRTRQVFGGALPMGVTARVDAERQCIEVTQA